MAPRLTVLLTTGLVLVALCAATAAASQTGEVTAGQGGAARLQSGRANCRSLTKTQFEHLGEYAMQRAVGSPAAHRALDAHLSAMMGSQDANQMHQLLGRTYAGCAGDSPAPPAPGPAARGSG